MRIKDSAGRTQNWETYVAGKYLVGSMPAEHPSYGLLTVVPRMSDRRADRFIPANLEQVSRRAYTIPKEEVAHITNRNTDRLATVSRLLYDRLLSPRKRHAFNIIYVPRKTEDNKSLIETALVVTSGYPLGSQPLMMAYSNGQPVSAVVANGSSPHVIKVGYELRAINEAISRQLREPLEKIEVPFIVFENGSLSILTISTGQIFGWELERIVRES